MTLAEIYRPIFVPQLLCSHFAPLTSFARRVASSLKRLVSTTLQAHARTRQSIAVSCHHSLAFVLPREAAIKDHCLALTFRFKM